jgi:hypothetical protein
MTKLKLLSAIAILAALAVTPSLVQARSHHVRLHMLPYEISFKHNYGPGPLPGTFAYYDGPPISARTAAGIPATDTMLPPVSVHISRSWGRCWRRPDFYGAYGFYGGPRSYDRPWGWRHRHWRHW